jgi:hypothetical protein
VIGENFGPTAIMPLVSSAWQEHFGVCPNGVKAKTTRGLGPLIYYVLDDPAQVQITIQIDLINQRLIYPKLMYHMEEEEFFSTSLCWMPQKYKIHRDAQENKEVRN